MTDAAPAAGKWIAHLAGDTPGAIAAARALRDRLSAVPEALRAALASEPDDPRPVHRLRVATRRAAAAARLFDEYLPAGVARRLRRQFRSVRRAAAEARLADVHHAILSHARAEAALDARAAYDALLARLAAEQARCRQRLRKAARQHTPAELESDARAVLSAIRYPMTADLRRRSGGRAERSASPETALFLRDVALTRLPVLLAEFRAAGQADLREIEAVHALRIAGKQLRYGCELLAGCFPPPFKREVYNGLARFQERLGDLKDAYEIVLRQEDYVRKWRRRAAEHNGLIAELTDILAEFRAARDERHREFLAWWRNNSQRRFVVQLEASLEGLAAAPPAEEEPVDLGHDALLAGRIVSPHRRVAAIDVGTNSIRMVVAETDPVERFRIIKDVKETTRLGSGLYQTGRLKASAVKRALEALGRMKGIAESQAVERLRAVATSAAREAANGPEFAELVERRTGITLEIIDGDLEARLAYASVANAFPLDDELSAIVDIGGGSTEIVFSRQGVIEDVFKLPLGAVRLTENFGDPELPGTVRYAELRHAVERTIHAVMPNVPFRPERIIGSGGTFTNLARLSIRRGGRGSAAGRFPFDVRGHELPHGEVQELLDWLRGLSLDERRLVPGLSSQRAEIIVAGFCIIERLLAHLRAPRVRVHDGGIRDGLLLAMIDELGFDRSAPVRHSSETLRETRRFAEQCEYEQPHSEHVAWLATRIFDQLATQAPESGGGWARPANRDLLLAAGVLHDIGLLHGFARHHKRSYEMIMHARLPAFTHREVEIIANVARYHRRRAPSVRHREFGRLSDEDQRLVARLAGILRIADGLDRMHIQNVRDVHVAVEGARVRFTALADRPPRTNLRYAGQKAGVFAAAYQLEPVFDWTANTPSQVQELSAV